MKLTRKLNINNKTLFNSNEINYIAVGSLTYQKGFDRLLEWFSGINKPNSILRIIGIGPLQKQLVELSYDLNISDKVIFMGYKQNPWNAIAASDVLLMPSRWEGMPNVVLESLACGTPVIATAESGGVIELSLHASKNVIKVVSSGLDFCEEMKKIKPLDTNKENDSLLPEIYYLENVIEIFCKEC